jgi:hypothetical protein
VVECIEDIIGKTGEKINDKPGLEVVEPDHLHIIHEYLNDLGNPYHLHIIHEYLKDREIRMSNTFFYFLVYSLCSASSMPPFGYYCVKDVGIEPRGRILGRT